MDRPKILAPLSAHQTIWSVLHDRLAPLVDHIHLVLSPDGARNFPVLPPRVSHSIQPEPTGMGDAIFGARAYWDSFDAILVVWGDQAGLSSETLGRVARLHADGAGPRCTLPVVEAERPYVQYVFRDGSLASIRQVREGAHVDDRGFSDVGVFLLEVEGLQHAWRQYLQTAAAGAVTGEVNFLPFLVYLSQQCGWKFETVRVADPVEARGINTQEDLKFFQERWASCPRKQRKV